MTVLLTKMCTLVLFQFLVHHIRLTDGPDPHAGRVEVYANSTGGVDNAQWGTICDDNWDIQDARVVCHQLGYPDAVAAPLSAYYGEGTGPILLDNVKCHGNESDIFACVHNGIGSHNCDHDQDASVECSSESALLKMLCSIVNLIICMYICGLIRSKVHAHGRQGCSRC